MAYTPKVWENDETEVDETNMNHIEQGIKDNDDKLQGLTSMGNIIVDSIRSKNVFDENWTLGSINVIDGSINPDTASTSIVSTNLIPVKPNTNYVISFSGGNYTIDRIAYFDSSGTFISRSDSLGITTFTTDANTYFIRFNIWLSGITPSAVGNTQLEEGSIATPYAPYQNLDSTDEINAVAEDLLAYVSGTKPMGNIRCNKLLGEISNLPNPVVGGQPSKNLDNFVGQGTFTFDNGDNSYSNAPTTDGIHVLVVTNNGSYDWVVQEDYVLRWGTNPPVKYIRNHTPAGWSSWQSTT